MIFKLLNAIVIAGAMIYSGSASAQDQYPSRLVRLIIPSPPGSGTDVVGRALANRLATALGQPIVVENKAGASGLLAAAFVAHSAPDGYTILLSAPAPIVTFPHLQKLSFDPLKDLTPVTLVVRFALIWAARPGLKVNSIPDLIELEKRMEKKGAKMTVGFSGIGGSNHLAILMLNQMAGIHLLLVPYKGESPALMDLMGGHVDLVVTTLASAMASLQGGQIRALATTTSERIAAMPELKTVSEYGFPSYSMEGWGGIFVPTNTPKAIVMRLNKEIVKIVHSDEMRKFLIDRGGEAVGDTPEQFSNYIRTQSDRNGKLVKLFHIATN